MKFVSIAVCDDDVVLCGEVENILINSFNKRGIECSVDVFNSGDDLYKVINGQKYSFDLLLLDIEMPNKTGVEIGSYIRNELDNQKIEIAYISSKTSYAMSLFEVRPINFLTKPLTEDAIEHLIDSFLRIKEQNDYNYKFKMGKDYFSISYSDILYFEHHGRKTTVHTFDKVYEHYASMENIYSKLKNYRFLFVHKSYIVNFNYIEKVQYEQVVVTDGTIIPISQSRRSEIQKQIAVLFKED